VTPGARVQVVEVFHPFDARHHVLGTLGTITRLDPARPWAPYVVTHDCGAVWRYGARQLRVLANP
jgi:hypothetical protein